MIEIVTSNIKLHKSLKFVFLSSVVVAVDSSASLAPAQAESTESQKSKRKPEIDVIRVGLTWGILLFHVVLIYIPWIPYYVKDPFYDFVNNTAPGADVSQSLSVFMYTFCYKLFVLHLRRTYISFM